MSPIKLTPRREAVLDRAWRILSRLTYTWAWLVVLLVFTGAWSLLPGWVSAAFIALGLLGTLLVVTACCAALSERGAAAQRHGDVSMPSGATRERV